MTQQYGDFQLEIYRDGTKGVLPRYPVDPAGLERKAAEALPPWILSYVAGGCGNEHTQRANVTAFEKWGIVPRMFNGSYERDLSIELFGMRLPTPLFTVPIGVIGVCSQDFHGDLQVARAAARTGVPVMQSTLSMDPMEDLVPAMGDTPGFFQLYTPKDRDLAVSLIQRAEAAGFKAIAVTLDTWVTGWRPGISTPPTSRSCAGTAWPTTSPTSTSSSGSRRSPQDDVAAAAAEWASLFGYSLTWDDLKWIREATTLPIVVKGISHPDDARKAIDLGVGRHLLLEPRRTAGERRTARAGHAARRRRGRGRRARPLRLRSAERHRRREGPGARRDGGRRGPVLRLRPRPRRRGRPGALHPGRARRGRPADGHRRLPDDRRPASRVDPPCGLTPIPALCRDAPARARCSRSHLPGE